jgi:hypothetical protein
MKRKDEIAKGEVDAVFVTVARAALRKVGVSDG